MKSQVLTHGGDWAGFEEEYGYTPLDLSANVSPFGVPEGVIEAIREGVEEADRYPDPLCRALRKAIGEARDIDPAYCLCGNGAADLIFRLALAERPKKALVTGPTFAEYRTALETVDCRVETCLLKEEQDFRLQEDILDAITDDVEMVFLCEPNNPTGISDEKELLLKVMKRCEDIGALLVVDECFHDFIENPERNTLELFVADHPRLMVLKAFTKMYGMAGVRLGYCLCSDEALLERMTRCGQPWSVSSLAQCAGVAALKEEGYVEKVRELTATERPYLQKGLEALGYRVIPDEANYLLFRGTPTLGADLRKKGILIRSCANYEGLDETWYRTAVRTREESQRFLDTLAEIK